jgi:hypothetical protein
MAKKRKSACSCVVDTSGLHLIATASANLKTALLARLADGTIGVPTWAWQELKKVYQEDAEVLAAYVKCRVQFNSKIDARAAQLTEINASGFSLGAYDEHIELYTASAAHVSGYTALTSPENLSVYDHLQCEVRDLITWVEEQE